MSRFNRYKSIDVSTNATVFEFTSKGPKGEIKKIIQFTETARNNIFNLSFGNIQEDGSLDDSTTNDNKDRDKILATVAAAVYDFTKNYPKAYVFFTGSSHERTRLYRMAITINFSELIATLKVWGLIEGKGFESF